MVKRKLKHDAHLLGEDSLDRVSKENKDLELKDLINNALDMLIREMADLVTR